MASPEAPASVTVAAPRLSLNQPLRWQRDEQSPQFNGEFQLAADKVSFSDGGYLPAPVLALPARLVL